ncbi:MAG: ribose-phosphate diphosphokinase [Spirochaetes bacterium]|nr:ribose-phosphate diphosphokinase [Spirochaetota bacterium]
MAGRGKIQIFSGRACKDYSNKVLKYLKEINEYTQKFVDLAGETKVKQFSDGEMEVEIMNSVRRKDVYIIQNNALRNEVSLSVHENKSELYHMIDALKRARAETITVIEPYISCARSDRATGRSSVGLWIHFNTMINLGASHIITFQLHSAKSTAIVDPNKCYIDNIPIISLLEKHILKNYIKTKEFFEKEVAKNWTICSVDAGGESIAREVAATFNCQLIIGYKKRNYNSVNQVEKVSILTDQNLEGKTVWVIDDMIDTGGSVFELVKAIKNYGVKTINIAVVHPVFSGKGVERLKMLHDDGFLDKLIVCDTLAIDENLKKELSFIDVVETSPLLANIIYKTNIGESLNEYFIPINPYDFIE